MNATETMVRSPWAPFPIIERPATEADGQPNGFYEADGIQYFIRQHDGEPAKWVRDSAVPCGVHDWCAGHTLDVLDLDDLDSLEHSRTVDVLKVKGLALSVSRVMRGDRTTWSAYAETGPNGSGLSLDQLAAYADDLNAAAAKIHEFVASERREVINR